MRFNPPSSRAKINLRVPRVYMTAAALSPYAALYVRGAQILYTNPDMAALYCLISFAFTIGSCLAFRVDRAIPRFFAVNDALNLIKAVVFGELLTAVLVFSITRLDGVPRSVPIVHAIILSVFLFSALGVARFVSARRGATPRVLRVKENIIVIGLDDVSAFLLKFLEETAAHRFQVVALLDTEPRWVGRTVNGVCVLGPPSHLQSLVAEFAEHGVRIDRIVVGGNAKQLPMEQIRSSCKQLNLGLESAAEYLSTHVGTGDAEPGRIAAAPARRHHVWPAVRRSEYFFIKARVEFPITVFLIILALPGFLLAGLLALLDVGTPILFWQQRIGLHGGDFRLYKFRTLRHAFESDGRKLPRDQRLSWAGRLLRRTRLDELPQLLNVLVGDMALIGPRPLLPEDQPANPSVRLSVRPGLTGWAQVNGGVLLSPDEKYALDVWYIQNASLLLDLKIAALSVLSVLRGDRKSEKAIVLARTLYPVRMPDKGGLAIDVRAARSAIARRA